MTWLSAILLALQILHELLKGNREQNLHDLQNIKKELEVIRAQQKAAADTAHLASDPAALADKLRHGGL